MPPAPRAARSASVGAALEDALDEDPGGMDLIGVEFADLDELLHLRDRDGARHRGQRIEVPGGLAVDEVPERDPLSTP